MFLVSISNVDDLEGNVTVTVFCSETGFSVSDTKSIKPGESHVFELEDSSYGCQPEYLIKPRNVRRQIK